MPTKKHLLVTNDDGIDSYFLKMLVEGLQTQFKVTVAAPLNEQSWIGRALSRRRDVSWEQRDMFPGCEAYAIDGTPSDCVNIALSHLLTEKPDAVCSGMNIGYNATLSLILTSGTVAGAMEGAFWGLPAVAFSHQVPSSEFEQVTQNKGHTTGPLSDSLKAAGRIAATMAEEAIQSHNHKPIVHNVNFPFQTHADTPIQQTQLAPFKLGSLFTPKNEQTFHFRYTDNKPDAGDIYDYNCLQKGNISRSVLDYTRLTAPLS